MFYCILSCFDVCNGRKTKSGCFFTKIAIRINPPPHIFPSLLQILGQNYGQNPTIRGFFNGLVWANSMKVSSIIVTAE